MASACALEWVPESLYNTAVTAIVCHYARFRDDLKLLTPNVQFDIYYKLYNAGRLCQLGVELSDLDVFARVLKVTDKRHLLHHCFQALMDHGIHISETLAESFRRGYTLSTLPQGKREQALDLGFTLGSFLGDAGWLSDSDCVYTSCLTLSTADDSPTGWLKSYESCIRLLDVRVSNCAYTSAKQAMERAFMLESKLTLHGYSVNKATLYANCCSLFFGNSQYDRAYSYCCKALDEIVSANSKPKAIVDILRQCSKACVVKREFKKAEDLISYVVRYARDEFGTKHHKYSDVLLDYGFYLLNVDYIESAVNVYQTCLDIRQSVFGGNNLHVAIANEDLAYASYVHQYSSGKFNDARDHAVKAIEILTHILPPDHLLLSSTKRVKALILEEIAIDSHIKQVEDTLLTEAHELHQQSLALARRAFGENNVQTAKHYGNLGRLYQSMHRYEEAEVMHKRAISIKEALLGPDDFETALSVGHLASLYNYDMLKYSDAEKLHLRSISIGSTLFGKRYSGLEYDYRGLIRLYQRTADHAKADKFRGILQTWAIDRDQALEVDRSKLDDDIDVSLEQLIASNFH